MLGVLMACAPPRMPTNCRPYDILAIAIITAGLIVAWVIEPHPRNLDWFSASWLRVLVIEDKTSLHPFRVASILSLTWLCARLIRPHAGWLQSRWAAPFVLIGQNSLPVFCAGIVLGFAARLALEFNDRATMQAAINLFGAAGMVGVGALAAWYRVKDRPGRTAERRVEPPANSVEPRWNPRNPARIPLGSCPLPTIAQADTG